MRFISIYCLRDGMILGRNLYGKSEKLLLSQGQVLRKSYIEHIRELGYNGVYVEDGLSEDVEIEAVVNEELRMTAVTTVQNAFISTQNQDNIDRAMEDSRTVVQHLVNEILNNSNAMVNIVDMKVFDDYTFYHSVNVAILSLLVGVSMGLTQSELYRLGLGALLHDIGKVFVGQKIVDKPGQLTKEEMAKMQKHPTLGYEFLRDHSDLPVTAYVGALQHHERYDGSGYPAGLKGDEISKFARIIAVADVYDALNSDRPYRRAILPSNAMEYIMGGSGTYFDPRCVEVFTRKVAAFPLGTIVSLSNGMRAIVVDNFSDCCMRPSVRLLSGEWEGRTINLRSDKSLRNVTITEVLNI